MVTVFFWFNIKMKLQASEVVVVRLPAPPELDGTESGSSIFHYNRFRPGEKNRRH